MSLVICDKAPKFYRFSNFFRPHLGTMNEVGELVAMIEVDKEARKLCNIWHNFYGPQTVGGH